MKFFISFPSNSSSAEKYIIKVVKPEKMSFLIGSGTLNCDTTLDIKYYLNHISTATLSSLYNTFSLSADLSFTKNPESNKESVLYFIEICEKVILGSNNIEAISKNYKLGLTSEPITILGSIKFKGNVIINNGRITDSSAIQVLSGEGWPKYANFQNILFKDSFNKFLEKIAGTYNEKLDLNFYFLLKFKLGSDNVLSVERRPVFDSQKVREILNGGCHFFKDFQEVNHLRHPSELYSFNLILTTIQNELKDSSVNLEIFTKTLDKVLTELCIPKESINAFILLIINYYNYELAHKK